MKINNSSFYVGGDAKAVRSSEQSNNVNSNRTSIDGSALKGTSDPIAAKREEARKKAMQIVGRAFTNEQKIDDDLNARRVRITKLQQEKGESSRAIKEYEEDRSDLREMYGIEEDSQEEKDLKLLEKDIRSQMPENDVHYDDGDLEKIAALRERGLTEYQQRSLEMLEQEVPHAIIMYENKKEIMLENQIISATENERLKSNPILTAQKQAEAIMDGASKEIMGMIVDEARDHIEEEADKDKEKAKAEKEKEEELQERIDAAKERRKENEKLTENIVEGSANLEAVQNNMKTAQQDVKDMMSKLSLIEDDLKGAAVDNTI